jgi:hypothetical protein
MKRPGGESHGCVVSTRAEMALYVVCYMARHYQRTSHTMTGASITLVEIVSFSKGRTNKEGYRASTEKIKLTQPAKILDFMEEWPEHLVLFNGQNGGLMSYIIRIEIKPRGEAVDVTFGNAGSRCGTPIDEIEERAPHGTPEYQVDNAKVFEMLNLVAFPISGYGFQTP